MLQILIEYLVHYSVQYILNIYESLIINLRFTFIYIQYLNLKYSILIFTHEF